MKIPRRTVLKAGAAVLAAPAILRIPGAYAASMDTIRLGLFNGVGLPGIFGAVQMGYFQQQNIIIDMQFFGNGPAMVSAVLGGSLDVTHADTLSWATAILGNRNIVLVTPSSLAPTPEGDPKSTWRVAASKASGITTAAGLAGKKIGVGASQLSMVTFKAWLEKTGLDPNSVHLEIVGSPQAMPNMLSSGAVDAALLGDPTIEQLDKQIGITVLGWPYEVVPPEAAFSGLFSAGEYAGKNKDLLVRFVQAFRRGAVYFNEASPIERARLMKLAGVDLESLDQKFPGLIKSFRYNRAADKPINVAQTQQWIDMGVKYGGVPKPVDVTPFIFDTAKGTLG